MIKKYKHISFDLDGTLVHTIPEYRHKIVPDAVNKLGGKIKNLHAIDKFWFEAERNEIIKNEFNLEPADFWVLFRKLDSPNSRDKHTIVYNDSEKCLHKLKSLGKIISIITGAPHFIAEMEIKKLNGAPVDYYLSLRDDGFGIKPNPAGMFHLLEKMCIKPSETVYIGNSNEDAYFAKNAGIDFIYLERKEHQFDLKDYSIATIHSLSEL